MWTPVHNENALQTNVTPLQVQFSLHATLLLIGWNWKLVKQVNLLKHFGGVFVRASGFYLSIICQETKVEWQIMVRLMMVSRFLGKTDFKWKNWLKQIAIERRKIFHKCKEFHGATREQRTLKLIVASLLLTYGNSATKALLLTVA